MTGLTDAEREASKFRAAASSILIDRAALDEQIEEFFPEVLDDLQRVHEAILAARLAPIEALAAEWEADHSRRLNFAAADLRAALADPQPGASGVGSGGAGGGA